MTGLFLEDTELISLRKLIYHPYNDALTMLEDDEDVLDVLTKISKHLREIENENRLREVEDRMAENGLTRCKYCNQIGNHTGGTCSNCYM